MTKQSTETIRSRIVGVNVPPLERIATGALGVVATVLALRRRSASMFGAGLALTMRAITGRSALYRARAIRDGIHVRRAVTIQASPREVYDFWRDLANLPRFMEHVTSVEVEDARTSRWTITEGPAKLSWRAEIVEEDPGRRLRWRSLPGGDLWNEGAIELRPAPGDRGTVIDVKITYRPPGGILVASVLYEFLRKLTSIQIGAELTRFQQLIETGEIATGARRPDQLRPREKALGANELRQQPEPVVSAQSSTWQGA